MNCAGPAAAQRAQHGWPDQLGSADLEDRQRDDAHRRWRHVGVLAGHPDHRAGVQAGEHQADQPEQAGHCQDPGLLPGPQGLVTPVDPAVGVPGRGVDAGDPAVEIAELEGETPDEDHVQPLDPGHLVPESQDVDDDGQPAEEDEHQRVIAAVQPDGDRHQADERQVAEDEPQRRQHHQHGLAHPGQVEHHPDDDAQDHPGDQQRRRRDGQRLGLPECEMPQPFAAGRCPLPGLEVYEGADVEEHRQHLQQPGDDPQAGGETQRAGRVRALIAPDQDGEAPVPEDDDEQREGP